MLGRRCGQFLQRRPHRTAEPQSAMVHASRISARTLIYIRYPLLSSVNAIVLSTFILTKAQITEISKLFSLIQMEKTKRNDKLPVELPLYINILNITYCGRYLSQAYHTSTWTRINTTSTLDRSRNIYQTLAVFPNHVTMI